MAKIKTEEVSRTSLKVVREEAAKCIMGLKDGSISPLVADSIYKQSLAIVDSYRVQLRGVELAIETTKERLDFADAELLIDTTVCK